ncbi:hypothetical protein ACJMK2_042086 [Sinanodonta woodiana]|uniref:RB1-inducible coiled-coil protein 1 n=1 Tax=Sinanodonta woodiana TaxID=1069815 RepID=A0ABD3W6Y0_SINWO
MLYVFYVDTGTMITFEMDLALESVSKLQGAIARACRIPEDKQVLLISGGESLDPNATVGKYHAGTDTNPIFLFNKSTIEAAIPPSPSVNYGSDIDLQGQVEGSLLMPPAYETVHSRSKLAQKFSDVDKEELIACERLVHDQHLQHQGWAAVVANLEDITVALHQRSELFQEAYANYMANRASYRQLLSRISDSLHLLAKIPVLPCLLQQCEFNLLSSQASVVKSVAPTITDQQDMQEVSQTLYNWISSQDPHHSLQDMVDQCIKTTQQLDSTVGENQYLEVQLLFKEVNNENMKEVKGLEDRLYGLDQMMSAARKIVEEQSELAKGFSHNQNRASDLGDKSVLPDLCASHKKQLLQILKHHKNLREIKKKCRMAKEDLSGNLHTRLRWVMYVEKKISDVDGKLMIYHESLKRLCKRLDILQQINDAPQVYAQLIVEAVRRKQFSSQFLQWARGLALESSTVHSEEVRRRDSFLVALGRHFLQSLFPGLEDIPPNFATEAPPDFDERLPCITESEITMLKDAVPELSELLNVQHAREVWTLGDFRTTKDSSVQWVDMSDHDLLHVPCSSSINSSDIDIIHSEHQLTSMEGTSISLVDEVAELVEESGLMTKPDLTKSITMETKEFPLPKCLSESLTRKMKEGHRKSVDSTDGNIQRSFESSGGSDKLQKSGGEQGVKGEGSSENVAQTAKSTSTSQKQVIISPVTSPDLETSQEFTTADFYIDESMPSSIGDSPPCKGIIDEKKDSVKALIEKCQQCEKLQAELKNTQLCLTAAECKIKTLSEIINDKLRNIQADLQQLEKNVSSENDSFLKQFQEVQQSIVLAVVKYDLWNEQTNKENIFKLKNEFSDRRRILEERLSNECTKTTTLETQISSAEATLVELEQNCNKEIERLKDEKEQCECSLRAELEELKKAGALELEIEVDRIRAEMEERQKELEDDLEKKEKELNSMRENLHLIHMNKVKLEESLTTKFQKEKDQICDILEKNYKEKLDNAIWQREEAERRHREMIEMVTQGHNEEMQHVKNEMLEENRKSLDLMRATLNENYMQELQKLKQKMSEEKENEILSMEEAIRAKYDHDLSQLLSTVNADRDILIAELEHFTKRQYSDFQCQSEPSSVSEINCQTDLTSLYQSESQIQTEEPQISETYCQTNQTFLSQCETHAQTEAASQCQISMQTETLDQIQTYSQTEAGSNSSVQTNTIEHSQMSVQTSIVEQAQISVQTEIALSQTSQMEEFQILETSVQTEAFQVAEISVQTEAFQISETSVQTEHIQNETLFQRDNVVQMENAVSDLPLQIVEEYEMKLRNLQALHESMTNDLVSKLEKEKEVSSSLRSSITNITAEKQVTFNEALNKISQEKDRVIEEMKKAEAELKMQIELDKDLINKLEAERTNAERKYQASLHEKMHEHAAEDLDLEGELARQQFSQYQPHDLGMSEIYVSAVQTSYEAEFQQKLRSLEEAIKLKDEEISKMQQKMMDLSMTTSTRSFVQDKVSITSCNVGDLVLLCLDERHDQYVVFTVGNTLHFLHTDCLDTLGLKMGPSEARKPWVLAEITDKEYCQAKKAQNRFKVPEGTRFYRVKAKPWSREPSRQANLPL